MKSPHKVFEDYLEKNDGRYTLQKRLIASEIFKTRSHFEIDDFISKQHSKKNRFARATVYRTVKQLFDAGLIQKIDGQDGKVFYERSHPNKHHDHLICKSCSKILEIDDPLIEQTIQKHCDSLGFSLDYRSLHIYGTCKKCEEKNKKKV